MNDMIIANVKILPEGISAWQEILHPEQLEEHKEIVSSSGERSVEYTEIKIPSYTPPEGSGLVIFLEEEYGYRYWVWETGMDWDSLKKWVQSLHSQKQEDFFLLHPENLPGKIVFAGRSYRGMVVYPDLDPKSDIDNQRDDACPFEGAQYISFKDTYGKGHVHMFDDSWISFGGETVYPQTDPSNFGSEWPVVE